MRHGPCLHRPRGTPRAPPRPWINGPPRSAATRSRVALRSAAPSLPWSTAGCLRPVARMRVGQRAAYPGLFVHEARSGLLSASVFPLLEPRLPSVSKPIQYVGGELNSTVKAWESVDVRWALMYPDAYEVGLPNQGVQILYEVLNEQPDVLAERTYAVWPDLETLMREHGVPQFTVDSHRPVRAFDLFGISFSTELGYTNLQRPRPGRHPLHAVDRGDDDPVVIAGATPRSTRADLRLRRRGRPRRRRGDRAAISEVVRVKKEDRPGGATAAAQAGGLGERLRPEVLRRGVCRRRVDRGGRPQQAGHPLPDPQAHADGPRRLALPSQAAGAARRDRARAVQCRDLPWLHARLPLLPGRMITRPVRERSIETIGAMVENGIRQSGFEEVGLLSLSSADHPRSPRWPTGWPTATRHQCLAVAAEHPCRRLQHHPRRRVLPQRPPLRADLRPRGRQRPDAQGDQQGRRRGGPDPHRRDGVLPRLAAGKPVLHVRPPDRDRRGRPRDRRPGDQGDRQGP